MNDLQMAEFKFAHSGRVAPTRKKDGTIRMFAMPFGKPSVSPIMADWRAQFQPEAFEEWWGELEAGETTCRVYADAHKGNPMEVLASSDVKEGAGMMSVRRDTHKGQDGIVAEFIPADTTAGRDISNLVSSGVINACSIGAYTLDDRAGWQKTLATANKTGFLDISAKTILPEISIVVTGGFSQAKIMAEGARALDLSQYKKVEADTTADTINEAMDAEAEALAEEPSDVSTSGHLTETDRAWVLSAIKEAVSSGLKEIDKLNDYLAENAAENLGGTSEPEPKVGEKNIWNTPY